MSHNTTERHIVPKGNYPFVQAGLNLFDCPTGQPKPGEYIMLNVKPGQLVAYTLPDVGTPYITVDATNIASITTDVYIGIGWDSTGDGIADDVRLIAGEHLTKCQVDRASVGKPSCGNPLIKAASIDCVELNETYTVKVTIDDNRSRSWGPLFKSGLEFTGTYTTEDDSCSDCPAEQNCKEVICGLVDALNNDLNLRIGDKPYPDWKNPNTPKPYRAVRGHKNWYTYCITPDAAGSTCEDCSKIDAVTTATINGETVTFNGNLDPADNTKTLTAQIQSIAYQLERAFDEKIGPHSGFAVVTKGVTDCCPMQLHVVTCDDNFDIPGLTPCTDALDLPLSFTKVKTCVDCDSTSDTPYEPECWLAIIVDPAKPDCEDCYLDKQWNWYGVNANIEFIKDAFGNKPKTKSKTLMEASSPSNFGSQIQWLEYKYGFGPAGRGRRHRASNYRTGYLNKWDKTSRIKNAVTAKCDALYCSYYLDHVRALRSQLGVHSYATDFRSGVHINIDDDVTLAAWETFFNALVTANNGGCKVVGSVQCIEP